MVEKWTPARDEQLAELWIAGTADEDISEAMGKTVGAVRSRAARLRMGVRDRTLMGNPRADGKAYWTAEEDQRLLDLRRRGMKLRLMGEALGRSWSAVHSRLQKLEDEGVRRTGTDFRNCLKCRAPFNREGTNNWSCRRCNEYAAMSRSQYDWTGALNSRTR